MESVFKDCQNLPFTVPSSLNYKLCAGFDPSLFLIFSEIHPNSIKVSPPDRGQHVSSENVSLSCEGNSSKWRVMRLTEKGHRSTCSEWGTMKNSTCDITNPPKKTAVYWCETASGQFSNAVNITFQMSSSEGSSFPLPLVLGLFFSLLTLMLLLLLCCYRKSTNTFVTRIFRPSKSQKTNQSPAADDVVDQNQTQDADESNDVTYSLILFKNRGKGLQNEPEEESSVYSKVKIGSPATTKT
ncbi:uncharacterized protein [Labrus bergylta]|uniref:uncharacterized protein isoform X2 n=1 Tax=Labrus bergylta TaxID=56723 RepID=UPI0033138FC8